MVVFLKGIEVSILIDGNHRPLEKFAQIFVGCRVTRSFAVVSRHSCPTRALIISLFVYLCGNMLREASRATAGFVEISLRKIQIARVGAFASISAKI